MGVLGSDGGGSASATAERLPPSDPTDAMAAPIASTRGSTDDSLPG